MQIIVGTSGWQYSDWNGLFYPAEIKGTAQLGYFAERFSSVEINSTFYHVPRPTTVQNWSAGVPDGFQFAIKLNRFLTHTKRVTSDEQFTDKLHEFYDLLQPLGDKLAAVLVQLPPSMRVDNARLEYLAEQTNLAEKRLGIQIPLAMEFRHASWFNDETYAVMRRHNLANVINDSPNRWPASRAVTADLAYIRFHGNRQLYRSSYSDEELREWAGFINKDCSGCRRVFCYFNNDYGGVALNNARTLLGILSLPGPI